jgi:hypothetical protein
MPDGYCSFQWIHDPWPGDLFSVLNAGIALRYPTAECFLFYLHDKQWEHELSTERAWLGSEAMGNQAPATLAEFGSSWQTKPLECVTGVKWMAKHLHQPHTLNSDPVALARDLAYGRRELYVRARIAVNPKLVSVVQGSIHYDGFVQSYAADATAQQAREAQTGNFAVPAHVADLLNSQGVPASPLGAINHAHPAHATIERHLHKVVYPGLIPERRVAVLQAKTHKVAWMGPRFTGPYNYSHDARDGSRWLPSSLPDSLDVDALFVWDVAQSIAPDLVGLLHQRYPNVARIYWSFVYAPETRDGYSSIWPDLYQLEYHKEHVVYKMEGSSQGAYVQPRHQAWLLAARRLQVHTPAATTAVQWTPLTSHFSHHLAVSEVGSTKEDAPLYSVTCTEQMRIPQPWLRRLDPDPTRGEQLVSRALYQRIWQYYETLPPAKRTPRDLMIKIRNESASTRQQHISTETWALLLRSIAAVSETPTAELVGNEFAASWLASLYRPLLKALVDLRTPSAPEITRRLLLFIASRLFPRLTLGWQTISLSLKAASNDDWWGVTSEIALTVALAHLTSAPLAALGALGAVVVSLAAYLQAKDRLQAKLHQEIACSTMYLNFGPENYAMSTPLLPRETFTPGPPRPAPPRFGLFRWIAGPGCPACGNPGPPSVCDACLHCPVHGVHDFGWEPGTDRTCCAAVREGRRLEAEFVRNAPTDHRLESLSRPDASGAPRAPIRLREEFQATDGPIQMVDRSHDIPPAPDPARSVPGRPHSPTPSMFSLRSDGSTTTVASSTPTIDQPLAQGFIGLPGDHQACQCPQHSGKHPVSGATWESCPLGFGFWAAAGRLCHLCFPPDEPDPHVCRCEEHRLDGPSQLCASGWPTSLLASARCHACPNPHRHPEWLHERIGVAPDRTASAWHPRLRVPDEGACPSEYPGTCAVEAMAVAVGVPPDEVWARLSLSLPGSCSAGLLPEPGLDERAFHAFGLLYSRSVTLQTDVPGAPRKVGLLRGPPSRFCLTERDGRQHWELDSSSATHPTPVRLNRLAPSPALDRMLSAMTTFKDSYHSPIPGQWVSTTNRPAHAKTYLRELRHGQVGTVAREQGRSYPKNFLDALDAQLDLAHPRHLDVWVVSGAPGCGKSQPFKQFFNAHPQFARDMVWFSVFPRNSLMREWRDDVPLGRNSWLHNTYELGLRRQARVLLVDEVSLLPPGYLDLITVLRPSISHLIILGDVVQCRYHNPEPETELNALPCEATRWFGGATPYLHYSHRIPQIIGRALGIPTSNPEEGRILIRHHVSPRWPVICMTDPETKAACRLGYTAKTVSSHQGAQYHTAQVMVHGTMLQLADSGLILTAATRVTHTLILILALDPKQLEKTTRQPVLHALLNPGKPMDFFAVFGQRLAGYDVRRIDTEALRAKRLGVQRASGTVYDRATPELQAMLTLMPAPPTHDPKPEPPPPDLTKPRTHLPRTSPTGLMENTLARVTPREERELRDDLGMSLCFDEGKLLGLDLLTSYLFPRQRANDPVLYRATIKKRLTAALPDDNRRDLQAKAFQASLLFDALLTLGELPRTPQPFDAELFAECVYENEFVKLTKKTIATMANNAERARPDWKLTFVSHFVKSQLKAKTETLLGPAKAGQTLATCSDLVVLLFGPIVRYLRRKVMDRLPKNIFVNCGKSVAEQSSWARRHWRDVRSTTSDYTGFDMSQRGDSLGLEYRLMRHFGLPEAFCLAFETFRGEFDNPVDLYLDWKLNIVSSAIGPKQTGRDTGEPGTYDFNTYFSMALYQLMYNPPRGLPLAAGGDDLAANAVLVLCRRWIALKQKFEIIAKVEHTDRPEFCGYYMTALGCYRNPTLLALKTIWHLAAGDAASVDVNYAAEAHTAYALGDHLHQYLSWQDLECLGWLVEYYHQQRPDLARLYFAEAGKLVGPVDRPPDDYELVAQGLVGRALRRARRGALLQSATANVGGLN